jgi:hypothetical protein
MRTPERTAAIRKYFTAFPAEFPSFSFILKTSLFFFLLGALVLFFFQNTIFAGIVLIFFAIGLLWLWIKPYIRDKKLFQERPPLEDMYKWLINDLHTRIKERATEVLRLNINTLIPENFMIVHYPIYWEEPGIKPEDILKRATEEENILYSIIRVQVIALTKNYISFFGCNYDWLNDLIIGEHTNEFFYVDITSVKNDFELISRKLIGEEEAKPLNALVFKLTNMSSDNLTVITKIPELNYSPKLEVSLERAIQALRIILRKRRFDEDQEPIIIKPENEDNETE